ncbi:MAG: hypothetical protein KIH64_004905 [Mycobacterium sp.]|nr:hypothetical protein [Mycobacterium sp.]
MIVWIIAGLLGMATGLRIGWALVNQQSVVSSAMIVALGGLAVVAALNWPPLTLLVNAAVHWPNISVALSQVALVASAAGSCVMITSVASTRRPETTRRLAWIQYLLAALIAALTLVLFLADGREPEMAPEEYLAHHLGLPTEALDWLVPLLYVLLALTVVSWVGMRLSSASRRGRALLLFTAGITLIVGASAFVLTKGLGRGAGGSQLVVVSTAVTMLLCAMAIVAAGALLPTVEDWIGARRELHLIEPLRLDMERRHPQIGIGVRPRGPLVFRVAERLSLISDALYLESVLAQQESDGEVPAGVTPIERAHAVAKWIKSGRAESAATFPGRSWLSQPSDWSDRDWILEIARQYRTLSGAG